jgi:hypothetical protein
MPEESVTWVLVTLCVAIAVAAGYAVVMLHRGRR